MPRNLPKYVNAFSNRQRENGAVRYLFRRRGFKAIPLRGPLYSEDFWEDYKLALGTVPDRPHEIGAARTVTGSIGAVVVTFYKSEAWSNLTPASQATFRPVIEKFRARHGSKRVAVLQPAHIAHMLAAVPKLSARDKMLKAIRLLMTFAIPSLRKDDPTAGISITLPKTKGHHSWTDEEIAQFRVHWPLGTEARLTMEFALETTSRRSEVARLGPQHIKAGRIKIERCHRSRDVDIRITPALQAAIDAMPKAHLTFLINARGKPYTSDHLAKQFAKWATAAGLPAWCRLHGLKKGGMRRIAERGVTTHELQSISGHKTLAMIQHYTDAVDRSKLADSAYEKLVKGTESEHGYTNTPDQITQTVAKPLKSLG